MLWSFFGIVLLIQSGSSRSVNRIFCCGKQIVSYVVAHALYVTLFYFIYIFISLVRKLVCYFLKEY